MATGTQPAQPPQRLADRLAAQRRQRFVGRETEVNAFRMALLAERPPFAVLQVYGPGGIGKTTLLREYARIAAEVGRPVIQLDGRHVDASPPSFLQALGHLLAHPVHDAGAAAATFPPTGVLLIDTFEAIAPLDDWLRETFLPLLPEQSLVVISGRFAPAPAWRTDLDWAPLTRIVSLRNFRPEESQTLLAAQRVPAREHPALLACTHGHPLALALAADTINRGHPLHEFTLSREPDMVWVLLERFVEAVPDERHRQALALATLAWATTEALVAAVLGGEDAPELFDWLRSLSFMEQGPFGLFPHDLARDVLSADLRWRNPDYYQQIGQQLVTHLHDRLYQTRGTQQQRVWFDLLYLSRDNPFMRPYFEWTALGMGYAEPATPLDAPLILDLVRRHEGEASVAIASHWLRRQPEAFLVYRTQAGEFFGFMGHLALHNASAEDCAADTAVARALEYVAERAPIQPGEEILYLRFFMHRDFYQAASPALNLTAINCSIAWTTRPKLAWNFLATAAYEHLLPHFTAIHIWRTPELDFDLGERHFGVFAHDWRVESAVAWLVNTKASLTSITPVLKAPAELPPPLVLSQPEFEQAVRQALRDFVRPDQLAGNPLLRSQMLVNTTGATPAPADLQTILREAAGILAANSKDEKFYRALWRTYFEPAPTQELAAELLDLPFNTYRYQLSKAIERVTAWLWQRESGEH